MVGCTIISCSAHCRRRALARRRVGKSPAPQAPEDLAAKQDAAAKRALDAIYARAARLTGAYAGEQ